MPLDALGNYVPDVMASDMPGGLQEEAPPVTPAPQSLLSRGISAVKNVFTPPQPGDQDYAQPLPREPTPRSEWRVKLLNTEETEQAAGRPGVLGTIGEELATREGLIQKLPIFGQLPEATKILRTWQAANRLKTGSYDNDQDEIRDLEDVTEYFNETRVRQKRDENRSFWGTAISYPIRSIPFALEIGLFNLIGRRTGLGTKELAGLGIKAKEQALMSSTRYQLVKGLNKLIGGGMDKLISERMRAYALKYGTDVVQKSLRAGSKDLMNVWIKEAKSGLAKNVLARNPGATWVRGQLGAVETDVARDLLSKSAMLRLSSRALEIASRMPVMAGPKLLSAGPRRQLQRGGISQDDNGNLIFHDSGETMPESVLKGATEEYFEYLSEYSGGLIQETLYKGLFKHLGALKLAQLAAKLPGGASAVAKLTTLMKSSMVKRGMRASGRFMNKVGREMMIYDPLSEYGEEIVNMVGASVFNLNDDGTPWATRVVKSLLHPVFEPKEALAMVLGFSILPTASFASGSVWGRLSDDEKKEKAAQYAHLIGGTPTAPLIRTQAEHWAIADDFVTKVKDEFAAGDSQGLFGHVLARLTGVEKARPGGLLDKVQQGILWGKTVAEVKNLLLKAPHKEAVAVVAKILEMGNNFTIINKLSDEAKAREELSVLVDLSRETQELRALIREIDPEFELLPVITPRLEGVSEPVMGQKVTPVEALSGFQRQVSTISLPNLQAAIASAKEVLAEAESRPEEVPESVRQDVELRVANLESLAARMRGAEFHRIAGPYMRFISDNPQDEYTKSNAFSAEQPLTAEQIANPDAHEHTRWMKSQGHWNETAKMLTDLLEDGKEVVFVPGAGFKLSKDEWAKRGYAKVRTGERVVHAMHVPARERQRERVYVTLDARAGDIVHEMLHVSETALATEEDIKREAAATGEKPERRGGVRLIAEAVRKLGESRVVLGRTKWSLPDFAERYFEEQARMIERPKGEKSLTVQEYIEGLAQGRIGVSKMFEEDVANLLPLYMGLGKDIESRPEMRGANILHQILREGEEESRWLQYAMESVIRRSPFLKKHHQRPMSPTAWKDLKKAMGIRPTDVGGVEKVEKIEKVEKVKKVEKDKVSAAPKPETKGKTKSTPAEVAEVTQPPPAQAETAKVAKTKGETEDKMEAPPPTGKTPAAPEAKVAEAPDTFRETLKQDFSAGEIAAEVSVSLAPVEQDVVTMARILSLFGKTVQGDKQVWQLKPGDLRVDLKYLRQQIIKHNLDITVMGPSLRKAYEVLEGKAYRDLLPDILAKNASDWMPKLLDALTMSREVSKVQEAEPGEQTTMELILDEAGVTEDDLPDPPIYRDEDAKFKQQMQFTEKFGKYMDLTYGADRYGDHIGTKTLPTLMYPGTMTRAVFHDAFKTALQSQDAYNAAVADPAKFLSDQAKKDPVSERERDFWVDHVAPVLRIHTFDELTRKIPGQELSIGDILLSTDLRAVTGVHVVRKDGPNKGKMFFNRLNTDRSLARRLTRQAIGKVSKIFQATVITEEKEPGSFTRIWLDEGDRVKALSPRFRGMPWKRVKEVVQEATEQGDVAVLKDAMVLVREFFPVDELPLEVLQDSLNDESRVDQIGDALYNFVKLLGATSFQTDLDGNPSTPQSSYRDILASLTGGEMYRKQISWGIIPHIYMPALEAVSPRYDTFVMVGSNPQDARTGPGIASKFTPEAVTTLFDLGLLPKGSKKVAWGNLRGEQYGSKAKEWSEDDRMAVFTLSLKEAEKSGVVRMPIIPMGNKANIPMVALRYLKLSELQATYAKVHAWLEKHGGTKGILSVATFNQIIANPKMPRANGNIALYAAILGRIVGGSAPAYRTFRKWIKYASQTVGGGAPSLQTLKTPIGVLRIAGLQLRATPKGAVPVTEGTGTSVNDFPELDGQEFATDLGAGVFGMTEDNSSSKPLLTGVTPEYQRFNLKGNLVYITTQTMKNLHPELAKLLGWANQWNGDHPDQPIHVISVQDNMKVTPVGWTQAADLPKALEWKNGTLSFNKSALAKPAIDQISGADAYIVAQLKQSTEPQFLRANVQMMATLAVMRHSGILNDLMAERQYQMLSELESLNNVPFDEFKERLANYYRAKNPADMRLKDQVDAGVDVRLIPRFHQSLVNMQISRANKMQPRLFGNFDQTLGDTLDPKTPLSVPHWIDGTGKELTGEELEIAVEQGTPIFENPADCDANWKGARPDTEFKFKSPKERRLEVATDILWKGLMESKEMPDIWQSAIRGEGKQAYIQLEKALLPDVALRLKDSFKEDPDADGNWSCMIRGEPVIRPRTPNSGFESVMLARFRNPLGKGKRGNWVVVNDKLVWQAGEDLDGDSRPGYRGFKDERGRPKGHVFDLFEADGRIAIFPPAGVKITEEGTATLAQMLMVRSMMYPGESKRYLNPAIGIDPHTRHLATHTFDEVAKPHLKALEDDAKAGFNHPDLVREAYLLPGKLRALPNAVRTRAVVQEILTQKVLPDRSLAWVIGDGTDHREAFGWDGKVTDAQAQLLIDTSGDLVGLVADMPKDLIASSLNFKANYIGLVMSMLMGNPRLKSLRKVEKQKPLESVEGTIEYLVKYLFTPGNMALLDQTIGFTDSRLTEAEGSKVMWNDPSLRDLLSLAYSLRKASGEFDLHRGFTENKINRFGERSKWDKQVYIFSGDSLPSTPNYIRTTKVVSTVRALLPSTPEIPADLADRLRKAQGPEFSAKYRQILHNDIYTNAGNPWFNAFLTPQDVEGKNYTVPVLSVTGQGEVEAGDLAKHWDKLPENHRIALIIHEIERGGLTGDYVKGSYANALPASAWLWLQEARKKLETTPGEQTKRAAAPQIVPGKPVSRTPVPPGAVSRAPAPVAPIAQATAELSNIAEETDGKPLKTNLSGPTPLINMSMGESELTYRSTIDLSPGNPLHKEMMDRFAFIDRIQDEVRLLMGELAKNSGMVAPDKLPPKARRVMEALSFFLNSGAKDPATCQTKLLTAQDAEQAIFFDHEHKLQHENRLKADTPTVAEIVAAYEEYRKENPSRKLSSFADLVKQSVKIMPHLRSEFNQKAREFADKEDFYGDIHRNQGVDYIANASASPFPKVDEISKLVREKLSEWYEDHKPGEAFELIVHPLGAAELVTLHRIPATPGAIRAASPKLTPAEIEKLVEAAKKTWENEQARQLVTTTDRDKFRKFTVEKRFKEFGYVLRDPNFISGVDSYARRESELVANQRYLSYAATLTDNAFGLPAALFIPADDMDVVEKQKVIGKRTARLIFDNWSRQLSLAGTPVALYDFSKTVWQNVVALMDAPQTKTWLTDNHYIQMDIKSVDGFKGVWVKDGTTKNLIEHVTSRGIEDWKNTGFEGVAKRLLKGLTWFALMTKQLALSFSLFHHAVLIEAHLASHGLTKRHPLNPLRPLQTIREFGEVWRTAKNVLSDPAQRRQLADWMGHGLTFHFGVHESLEHDPTKRSGPLDKFLDGLVNFSEKHASINRTFGVGARAARALKQQSDHLLWEVMQPAFKFMMAQRMYNEVMNSPDYLELSSTAVGRKTLKREIAQITNQTFGGVNWREMVWATPLARDILRATVFAPDWTFSNLQMAMVPDAFQKMLGIRVPFGPQAVTDIRTRQLLEKNWPAFVMVAVVLVPAAIQLAVYGAFGHPEDDDEPFIWMNEEGMNFASDITPLFRKLGMKFGVTQRRRSYIRWAKSGYEIGAWFLNPWRAFLNKSSMPVKVFWEQLTGRNTAGWDMPWSREDATVPFGGVFMVNGNPFESRIAYTAQKFLPMSLLTILDKRPATFFAPAAMGKSAYSAEKQIADILQAYGDDSVWYQIKGRPARVQNLETLVTSTLDAAWKNGYQVDQIMSNAKRLVHARQAAEFFGVLEDNPKNPNTAKLEKIARAAQRTDTAFRSFRGSMNRRFEKRAVAMTPGQQAAMAAAWQAAVEKHEDTNE